MFISGLITCEQGLDNYLVHYVTEYGRIVARSKMSIFFKFVVESGEPQSVKCGGMDMSLADLKLAIKDQRRFKNVTDFDLQVNIILYLMFLSEPFGYFWTIWFLRTIFGFSGYLEIPLLRIY